MKVAIVQPYLFPYLGYFQLINVVDDFVFFDDVHFIKKGWIHRNTILVNGKSHLFTVPCVQVSQNKLIKDVKINNDIKTLKRILKTIEAHYHKAPYFKQVYEIVESVFLSVKEYTATSELSIKSVLETCNYLEIKSNFSLSSQKYSNSIKLKKEKRLINICLKKEAKEYINPIGGVKLYNKEYFMGNNIKLRFLKSIPTKYKQFNNDFVPKLSIIDVMMFNSIKDVKKLLNQYELV